MKNSSYIEARDAAADKIVADSSKAAGHRAHDQTACAAIDWGVFQSPVVLDLVEALKVTITNFYDYAHAPSFQVDEHTSAAQRALAAYNKAKESVK